jgi:hypothetical protein
VEEREDAKIFEPATCSSLSSHAQRCAKLLAPSPSASYSSSIFRSAACNPLLPRPLHRNPSPPSAARESIFSPASLRVKILPQSNFSRPCSSDLVLEPSKARFVPLLFRHIFPSILFHNLAPVLDSFDSVLARKILVAAGDEPPEARDGPATTPSTPYS